MTEAPDTSSPSGLAVARLDPVVLSKLLDTAADGFLVLDGEGRVAHASATARRLLDAVDASAGSLAGKALGELAPGLVPDSGLPAPGTSCTLEGSARRLDGSTLDLALDIAASGSGEGLLYTAIVRDVTERRRDERLHTVLYEIAQAGNEDLPFADFLRAVDESLCRLFGSPNFFIALVDNERGTLAFPHVRDRGVSDTREIPQERLKRTLTAHVLRTGKPLLLRRDEIRAMADRGEIILLGELPQVWLGAPLVSRGQTIGLVSIQSYDRAEDIDAEDLKLMGFVSAQIAAAIERKSAEDALRRHAQAVEEARDRIEAQAQEIAKAHDRLRGDLATAARLQESRLPRHLPELPGVEFAWMFEACEEVAGDMFNVIPLDENRVALYVLDVSGHGVPAAFLSMTLSRMLTNYEDGSGLLRATRASEKDPFASPSLVADRLNRRFPISTDVGQFFTLLYGILDLHQRQFSFICAGHPVPVIATKAGAEFIDIEPGPAIGILPDPWYNEYTIALQPGEALLMMTDGIEEACDSAGRQFGMRRTLEAVEELRGESLVDLVEGLRRRIVEWRAGAAPSDDATILALRFQP